jgi:homocysteine S-methyltransferase
VYGIPSVISFTVETDGRLPTGQPLSEAIEQVDAETRSAPAYFMINCAHPSHFERELRGGGAWTRRIRGLRANASRASHAELDTAPTLDAGDPIELGDDYRRILDANEHITVLGGCCGTDHRHVAAIADACLVGAGR